MAATTIKMTQGVPVDANVVSQSPHVIAYRFWKQAPGEDTWTVVAEGSTGDDETDHKSLGVFDPDTKVIYWLIFGGKPNTPYKGLVTFGQSGAILPGGVAEEKGQVSSQGSAVLKREVVFSV